MTVHPRMGGEQSFSLTDKAARNGSSPHGRGTVNGVKEVAEKSRFIPAWAGNRSSRSTEPPEPPVHPRMGGEQEIIWG